MISIVLISVISAGSSSDLCPSPPVTYASVGDNVTLCWQIPAETNMDNLKRFTILALKRPVQLEMRKVASAGKDGKYFRTYEENHDGLYEGRVTAYADLLAGKLFFKMANYTSKMENVYCVLYEMSVINDVLTCHSHAVFLRTVGSELYSYNYVNSTETKTNSTETPQATKGRTDTRRKESYRTELIIVSCLLAFFLVVVIIIVVWFKRREVARKSSIRK